MRRSFTSGASASVPENGTAAYTATATDAEGAALSFSLSGTDAALFNIDAATGIVTFKAAPDFETPADAGGNNIYDIVVTASDGANTTDQAVAITVTDVDPEGPVFTSGSSASVPENGTAAYTAIANGTGAVTYSLSGTDAALFDIDAATGVVTFKLAPDAEAPADAGSNNVYDIIVTATDDLASTNQAVQIQVANINDSIPEFAGSEVFALVDENTTAAYTAVATDAR